MRTEKVKSLTRALDKKTGNPNLEFPTVLFQDTDGRWLDFNTVGKQGIEPVELDPRIRHDGGNHYLCSCAEGIDNRELFEWIQANPGVMFDHRD